MATAASSNRRASSSKPYSSSNPGFPPFTSASSSSSVSPAAANNTGAALHDTSNHLHRRSRSYHHAEPFSPPLSISKPHSPPPVHPSMLQPRVAVVLNVHPQWHPYLFTFRLLSILPALWWGLPCALQLVLSILPGSDRIFVVRGSASGPSDTDGVSHNSHDAVPFALTEGALATMWSFASGYLAFFFTDCLMSRWLIHYTPQATIVRLLTINAVNAYLTMTMLSLAGGFEDPRLMLPGWIGIATTLTVCYHITHQKINIRKETSTSINVFSIASYISMVALLAHMISFEQNYPAIPLVGRVRKVWNDVYDRLVQIKGSIEQAGRRG